MPRGLVSAVCRRVAVLRALGALWAAKAVGEVGGPGPPGCGSQDELEPDLVHLEVVKGRS